MIFCVNILFSFLLLLSTTQTQTVSLVYVDYPPYYSESQPEQGPLSELVTKAFLHAGYRVNNRLVPWARAYRDVKNGHVDGLYTIWYRAEREAWLYYSDPLPPNEITLLKNNSLVTMEKVDVQSLTKYKIGLVKGYTFPPKLNSIKVNILDVKSDKHGLIMLGEKRIDLFLTDKQLALYLLSNELKQYQSDISPLSPPMEVVHQYLVISKKTKNAKQKFKAFNQGLKALKNSGEYDKILKKHHLFY